jgi:hypothetical protein
MSLRTGETECTERQNGTHQDTFSTDAVGKRTCDKGADYGSDERSAQYGAEFESCQSPLPGKRGRNESACRRIETIRGNDQETQPENKPLVGREPLLVDESLNINHFR